MKFINLILVFLSILLFVTSGLGQDANTLLLLRFENSLNGQQGETPTQSSGHTFQTGVQGRGVFLPNQNQIFYSSANNFNALEGTVEFWIKPTWNGNDNQGYSFVKWGGDDGLLIIKDGLNNLRFILNRSGAFPGGTKEISVNIGAWTANRWHHLAFTYSNSQKKLRIFIDGSSSAEKSFTGELPPIADSTFQLGGDGAENYSSAVLDELRISNVARTPQEIAARYVSALTVTSLTASPNTLQMMPTWRKITSLQAATNVGSLPIPVSSATWTSSNPAVASFNTSLGKAVANSSGTATLTATVNGARANVAVNISAPVLPPAIEPVHEFLASSNPDALWEMPVVIINFLPTADGVNMDSQITGEDVPLAQMRGKIDRMNLQTKLILDQGSRFRNYSNSSAKPSLGYKVVSIITVYEEMPPLENTCHENSGCVPDYEQILNRFNGANFVNNLGVKEFWIWGYFFGNMGGDESNMSSPTTGDVSNSDKINDLPVYDKTYVLYNYNLSRNTAEAVHDHGHQLEEILSYANWRQDGNEHLFWGKFVGFNVFTGVWQRGRAGDTHHAPNSLEEYEYSNTNPYPSDIANWTPNGGTTSPVSLQTWRSRPYLWVNGDEPDDDECWWYIYWFQSMPGRANQIPYNTNRMTNWWQFTGDWDAAMRSGVGLYEASSCNFVLSSGGQNFLGVGGSSSVSVTAGAGCKWFASRNASWVSLTSGDIGNGNGTLNFTIAPNTTGNTRTTKIVVAGQAFNVMQSPTRITPFDFDGDEKADISIFRPSNGQWSYVKSSNGGVYSAQFGVSTDKITPGDFSGDGKIDIAVWRPSTGEWFILRSEDGTYYAPSLGTSGDIPVPADYDADGRTNPAVYRPSNSNWYIRNFGGDLTIKQFGQIGDVPVAADYDGDGKTDTAIYRRSSGQWWINRSSAGLIALQLGNSSDKPVQGDYTGDGKADVAIFRPSTGEWFVLRSENSTYYSFPFGTNGDVPAPGDFDGDGRFDATVFRPSQSTWYVQRTTAGTLIQSFGIAGDKPVPNAFVP